MKQKTKERIKRFKSKLIKALPLAGALACTGTMALAATSANGSGDTETFSDIITTLETWSRGGLGQALTLGTLLVGGGYAIATQSVKGAISAGGLALIMGYGPSVVSSIFTATF